MLPYESKILTNIHIEKNAGTPVQKWIQDTYGKKRILIYNPLTDSLIRADQFIDVTNSIINWIRVNSGYSPLVPVLQKLVLKYVRQSSHSSAVRNIPEETMIIHGHFTANKFDDLVPNALQSVVIGDPWKRMISHNRQWHKVRGQSNQRVIIPYDPKMSFEEFASLPELRNYQSQALANKKLANFAAVGTPEHLVAFTQRLLTTLPPPPGLERIPKIYRVNQTPLNGSEPKIVYSKGFEDKFTSLHSQDYEIFHQAQVIVSSYANNPSLP